MRVKVTFKDGVCLVVDTMYTDDGFPGQMSVSLGINGFVNDSDFKDLKNLEGRYGASVQRIEDLMGSKNTAIIVNAEQIKCVEFIA